MSPSRVSQTRPCAMRMVMPRRPATLVDWLRNNFWTVLMGRHGRASALAAPEAQVPGQRKNRPGLRDRRPGLLRRLRAETGVAGAHDRLRAILDLDLVEDVGDVVAHGLHGKIEARGDLRVVQSLRDELEDLRLPRGQAGESAGRRPGRRIKLGHRREEVAPG